MVFVVLDLIIVVIGVDVAVWVGEEAVGVIKVVIVDMVVVAVIRVVVVVAVANKALLNS